MFLAQAFTEYASAASFRAAMDQARYTVGTWLSSLTTVQWIGVGAAALVVMWMWRRR